MKETVLLTGFAGFIGSQILRDLLDKGYNVVGVDNLSEGSDPENFHDLLSNTNFHPLYADMGSPDLERNITTKIDFVINCGAQSHVDRSFDQYKKFIKSNILGPIALANLAIKWKVKKFIQISTDEIFADSEQPFTEDSLITPQNAYSSSKAAAEMFLKNFQRAFGLPLVITNGANTYGPNQLAEKIIPLTIKKIMNNEKVPLYITSARRMWLHVSDHSSCIIAAMENGEVGQRYCIAPEPENELYTKDLVEKICILLNKSFETSVNFVPDRPNYDLRYYMLNDKAKKELNWKPLKSIEEELPAVVSFYKDKFKI